MNKKLLTLLMILMIIACLLFFKTYKEGTECVANPFVYGVKVGSQSSGGDLLCRCSFMNDTFSNFMFDKDGLRKEVGFP